MFVLQCIMIVKNGSGANVQSSMWRVFQPLNIFYKRNLIDKARNLKKEFEKNLQIYSAYIIGRCLYYIV